MGTKNGNKNIFSKSFPVNVPRRSNLREVENCALEFAYLRVRPLCCDKEYQTGRNTKRQIPMHVYAVAKAKRRY
jgi:hypothetical protein